MRGGSLQTLKGILGHGSMVMVLRSARLAPGDTYRHHSVYRFVSTGVGR